MAEAKKGSKDHATVRGVGERGGRSNKHGERSDGTQRGSNSYRRTAAQA